MLIQKQQRQVDLYFDGAKKLGEAMKFARDEWPKVQNSTDAYEAIPHFCCVNCVYVKCEIAAIHSRDNNVPLVESLYKTVPQFDHLRAARRKLARATTKYRRILLLQKLK
jgi:hypothetical protein